MLGNGGRRQLRRPRPPPRPHSPALCHLLPPSVRLPWLGTERGKESRKDVMADLQTCVLSTRIASRFQMPSVPADTKVLALPCKVQHTFIRDTHGHQHQDHHPALSPDVSNAFSDALFRPNSVVLPSMAHPWDPLSQQAAFGRSPRAVSSYAASTEPTGSLGTFSH